MIEYRATYRFDGRGWICQFVEPDIATFGRTIVSAKAHARSLLAVHLEVDDLAAAGIEIHDDVRLPEGIELEIDALTRRRREAEALRSEVALATRSAAAKLRAAGLSTRDVGELVGISGARVSQFDAEVLHGRSPAGALRNKVRQVADEMDWDDVRKLADATPDPDRAP